MQYEQKTFEAALAVTILIPAPVFGVPELKEVRNEPKSKTRGIRKLPRKH